LAEDLGMGTVVWKRSFLAPFGLRRTGMGGVVLLASCGTGNEHFFERPPPAVGVQSATPSAARAPALTAGQAVGAGPSSAPGGGPDSAGPPAVAPPAPPGIGAGAPPPEQAVPGTNPSVAPPGVAPASAGEPDPPDDGAVDAPAGAPPACPTGATFCSSFEEAELPAAASYVSQRGAFVTGQSMLLDTSQRFSGTQSLLVPADTLMFDYRMLSVAIPGNDFWVRLYVRTDVEFGDADIDTLFLASVLSEGFNEDRALQLSEQLGQVVLNKSGQLFGTAGENPKDTDTGTRLAADEWHCLEAFFGGTSGDASVFLAGQPIISALAWRPETYQTFRFGYERFSTARNVWIDDVAVAAERIGCQ
jgi:hypothetical protein